MNVFVKIKGCCNEEKNEFFQIIIIYEGSNLFLFDMIEEKIDTISVTCDELEKCISASHKEQGHEKEYKNKSYYEITK